MSPTQGPSLAVYEAPREAERLVPPPAPVCRWMSRLAGLALLVAAAGSVALAIRLAIHAVGDSWIAPIHLSPDSEAVLQLEIKVSREQAEMARVEAEIQRIDGDLNAVEAALSRLSNLLARGRAPLAWEADTHVAEGKTVGRVIAALRAEVRVLERQKRRQAALTSAAREDLAGGLIDRRELALHEQAQDAIAIALAERKRMLEEARHKRQVASTRASAYRAGMAGPRPAVEAPVMPELAASDEHATRAELELMKLEAEKRSLSALRQVAEHGLARQRELLTELESRPLRRAIDRAIDLGFVPYDELTGVAPGAPVLSCTWSLFFCRKVGAIAEVLLGEVVTQDPWGDMARGQYVVLSLDDPEAVREKVLRVRP